MAPAPIPYATPMYAADAAGKAILFVVVVIVALTLVMMGAGVAFFLMFTPG
jgi:hypothetical protein